MTERLMACDAIADTAKKLACFDAVVKSLDDSRAAPEAPDPVEPSVAEHPPVADPPAMPVNPPPAAAPAAAAVTATASQPPAAPRASPEPTSAAAPSSEPAPAANSALQSSADVMTPEETFGLSEAQREDTRRKSQEPAREETLESIQATIVEAWTTSDHRFEARLDNGQVWRETERTRWSNRLPKPGSSVVISRGAFGSYRMKIGNNNRLAAVRRTD